MVLSGFAGAEEAEPFAVFLSRFCGDSAFRVGRTTIPLAVRLGNRADGEPVRESWSKEEIARNFVPPLSDSKLREYGLAERVDGCGSECRVVAQYRREAEDYLLSYQFEKRDGAWYLFEYRDESR